MKHKKVLKNIPAKPSFEELLDSSLKHQQFYLLQIEHLLSVLNELEAIADDVLVVNVIKNGKERHELDKLIFTRQLFGNKPETLCPHKNGKK